MGDITLRMLRIDERRPIDRAGLAQHLLDRDVAESRVAHVPQTRRRRRASLASIITCSARALWNPYSCSGNRSMMFSIMSAPTPCVLGGSSLTVQPRYVVWIGVTHSGWNSERSLAVRVPPWACENATSASAVGPR